MPLGNLVLVSYITRVKFIITQQYLLTLDSHKPFDTLARANFPTRFFFSVTCMEVTS